MHISTIRMSFYGHFEVQCRILVKMFPSLVVREKCCKDSNKGKRLTHLESPAALVEIFTVSERNAVILKAY